MGFAALSPPNPLPKFLAVKGKGMASGESYWLVQPVEAPYVLDRVDFGLEEGFWVIKVQHLQLTAIDPDTNHRTYLSAH